MSQYLELAPLLEKHPELKISSYGGSCPVQLEGKFKEMSFYFRLRHSCASLSVGGEDVVGSPLFYEELMIAPEWEDIGYAETKDIINIFSKLISIIISKNNF